MKKIFEEIISSVFSDIPSKYTVWLEAIDEQEDLTALQSAAQGLELALADTKLPTSIFSKILAETERKTNPILAKLNQQFVRFEYMDASLENNMLGVVYAFHKQVYASYIFLLEYFCANPKLHKKEDASALMHGAVNQAFEMLKWRSFVNLGLAPKVWLQLHRIFQIADDNRLLDKTIHYKSNDSNGDELLLDECTLRARLVQTYMLDTLLQANLNRQGVDIVCKFLRNHLLEIKTSTEFDPIKYLFYTDLEKDHGAKRIRHFTPTDSCIYWEIDALENIINAVVEKSSENTLDFATTLEFYKTKIGIETFSSVLREWSRKEYQRQRRKESRQKLTTTASVVHSIQEICERVRTHENDKLSQGARLSADGKSLDERLRSHTAIKGVPNTLAIDTKNHHWVIVDESKQGLGAVASREMNAWVSAGLLVGLALADAKQDMLIAVIRSARPKANRQMQIGLEVLSRHAKWVQLKLIGINTTDPEQKMDSTLLSKVHSFAGLYLPIEAGLSLQSMLLIPKLEFIPHAQYQISIAGMSEKITLAESIENKDDWVKVVYPR